MTTFLKSPLVRALVHVEPATVEALVQVQAAERGFGEKTVLPTQRDLLLQSLIHLPRIAGRDGNVSKGAAAREIRRQWELRHDELTPLAALAAAPTEPPGLESLSVEIIAADAAQPILAHFHYLRSFRPGSVNVAALYQGRIVALCSLSPLDLPELAQRLPITSLGEAAVVSRVFAFDWAPRNIVSYLLARVGQVAGLSDTRMLITYLNPNLGFTGASYRAANWRTIGVEKDTCYAYFRGRYITDRRLAQLSASERAHVEFSRMRLAPLVIYGRFKDQRLAARVNQPFAAPRHVYPT
jgi:hypothetical protein